MSQFLYSSTPVVPLSRAPQSAQATQTAKVPQAGSADPFPAQAVHACQVLARVLQRLPRPESVQLFTADHWSTPWLQVHLYPDPDDAQLAAYQYALGGLLTRTRRDGDAHSVVYTELATEFDQVRIQVWNVNESAPAEPPDRVVPEPEAVPDSAAPGSATSDDIPEERTEAEAVEAKTTEAKTAKVRAARVRATKARAAEARATDEAGTGEAATDEQPNPATEPAAAPATAADDAS